MQMTSDVITSLRTTWDQFADAAPTIVSAALLLVLGWLLARIARRLTVKLFRRLKVDVAAERLGIEGFLIQGGVEFTTITLLSGAVYWAVLVVTFVAVLNMLAVPGGLELLEQIVRFVPSVVLAVVVLLFGSLVSRFVGSVIFSYLSNVGSAGARPIATLARYAVLLFALAMAGEQIAFRSAILVSGFQIVFGALCLALALAFGLAFGLGGRDWAARILDKFFKP